MRTFVAIELSETARTGVASTVESLRNHLRSAQVDRQVRWVSASNLHLTLRFLGETSPAQYEEITAGLSVAVRRHPLLHLTVGELGCFPNMRAPRIVWLGVEGDLERLSRLQTSVEAAVQKAGYTPEERAFSPHLTIGRGKRGLSKPMTRALGAHIRAASEKIEADGIQRREKLTFVAQELVLMQSVLRPEGASYSAVEHFRFG